MTTVGRQPGELVDDRIRTAAGFDTVDHAVSQLLAGRPVLVVDDGDRQNVGDLVFAAELATPELVAFMVRYSSGLICVPMTGDHCDRLGLPPMYHLDRDRQGAAYTVSVDARDGVTSGISAADRAVTMRVLADPGTTAADLSRPGHVLPLRAREGGVLVRPGHTEAALELTTLAGLQPVAGICEVVSSTSVGEMARLPELEEFARTHDLALVSVADLVAYRRAREIQVVRVADSLLDLPQGAFRAVGYLSTVTQRELIALVHGDLADGVDVLVRVHSECLTGDVLGSLRCDCGPQLQASLDAVVAQGRGVVLYIRGHEGRGIGLLDKLRAYQLQDDGADTVDANLALGLPSDSREYGTGAQVLADLGIRSMRLLTNNPAKRAGLEGYGLHITGRVPLAVSVNPENIRYLTTKRDRMGHDISELGLPEQIGGVEQ